MAHKITSSCPTCKRVLRTRTGLSGNYGPPLVKCGVCGTLLETGLHKVPTLGDKFRAAGYIIVSIPLSILLTILIGDPIQIFSTIWVVIISIWMSFDPIKELRDYEKKLNSAKDDGIPLW